MPFLNLFSPRMGIWGRGLSEQPPTIRSRFIQTTRSVWLFGPRRIPFISRIQRTVTLLLRRTLGKYALKIAPQPPFGWQQVQPPVGSRPSHFNDSDERTE